MNPYFAVVGSSNGMLKVWTPTTVSPPAVSHKFKSITIDPNIVAGAIVGVARIEQVDPNGQKSLGLLTVSAKGSICLFRAYTWEPLSLIQVCMCSLSCARAVLVYIWPRSLRSTAVLTRGILSGDRYSSWLKCGARSQNDGSL
jgi:hypothetical protein